MKILSSIYICLFLTLLIFTEKQLDGQQIRNSNPLGKYNVKIAIVDTGINFYEFKNNLILKDPNNFGYNYSYRENFTIPNDNNGHGTQMAKIITKMNPLVKILPIKYYNKDDDYNIRKSNKALLKAINSDVRIINYSSSGSSLSQVEKGIIKKAAKKGILVIVAAGNDGKNLNYNNRYPASYKIDSMLVVGSSTNKKKRSYKSNYGSNIVDIFAPGEKVIIDNNVISGTSISTAYVTALASYILSHKPHLNIYEVIKIIKEQSELSHYMINKSKTEAIASFDKVYKYLKDHKNDAKIIAIK